MEVPQQIQDLAENYQIVKSSITTIQNSISDITNDRLIGLLGQIGLIIQSDLEAIQSTLEMFEQNFNETIQFFGKVNLNIK